jgi:hypothetical protein
MLVFGFCIEGVSGVGAYLPFGSLGVIKLIGHIIVRSFWGLFSVAIDYCHFLGNKFLGLGITGGCSEGKLRGCALFAFFHLAKGGVDLVVRKFDEILVSVDLFLLLFLGFCFCHQSINTTYNHHK